jgi:hypothetical protein
MTQRICAVRLPGSGRAHFADAGSVRIELGDWVAVDAGYGAEPGQIVVAPDQWTEPVEIDDALEIRRRLEPYEVERVAGNIEQARNIVSPAAETLRNQHPECFLTGLRLTLQGEQVIITVRARNGTDLSLITNTLSQTLGLPVTLEQEEPRTLLGGSTGVPEHTKGMTFRELLETRMDALREPDTFAPQGIPRLNSSVQTPAGPGRLVAVDIRHWKASVALSDGEEITLSVDDLRAPD